jgi:hypothetical protein
MEPPLRDQGQEKRYPPTLLLTILLCAVPVGECSTMKIFSVLALVAAWTTVGLAEEATTAVPVRAVRGMGDAKTFPPCCCIGHVRAMSGGFRGNGVSLLVGMVAHLTYCEPNRA